MKATLYDEEGRKKSQLELPALFGSVIREDIVQKCFEADKFIHPYSSKEGAGLRQSASGTISHKRHDWKGHYGRGIARLPRKTMWRRGAHFFWVGANVPGTKGGRKAHPPKGIGKEKKINKKEMEIAFNSGFAATANKEFVLARYETMNKIDSAPFVIELLPGKMKALLKALKSILGENYIFALKKKRVRAGKGKLRGRKYKSNAGVLIVKSKAEKGNFKGLDVKTPDEITISDLYPLGRLAVYTHKALQEIGNKAEGNDKK